ncbi:site-specific integrase [Methanosalsum natronophilum]|uniref:site-specific integrase n=1 Tax=Methanosalsum natronophilum TaxID=768733 RepID=UPI0021674514|nr:site-specific integrase [Methanosalsum natronophilum]
MVKDFDIWIETNKHLGNGQGEKIFNLMLDDMLICRLSQHSKEIYLIGMKAVLKTVPDVDYFNLTEQDIKFIRGKLVRKYENPATVAQYERSLRKWVGVSNQKGLLECIKIKNVKYESKEPEEVLTKTEVEAIIDTCNNPRDRALFALLYDSGCRIGELLSMRVKDVKFDQNGALVSFPEGKTGYRKNRVVFAASYLRVWVENHKLNTDPNAPLWLSRKTSSNEPQPLKYQGVALLLERLVKECGIEKRVHLHLFRHTRASELANTLTEQQLKKQLGWTQGSSMAARYVHMNDRDLENAILKSSGVEVDEEGAEIGIRPIRCNRCKDLNPPNAKFCSKCGLPIDQGMSEENIKNVNEVLDLLKQNPDLLIKALDKLNDD